MHGQRWVCSQCGSNNMPQLDRCFRCGAVYADVTIQSQPPVRRQARQPWFLYFILVMGGFGALFLVSVWIITRVAAPPEVRLRWIETTGGTSVCDVKNLTGNTFENVVVVATVSTPTESSGFYRGEAVETVQRGTGTLPPGQSERLFLPAGYYALRDLRVVDVSTMTGQRIETPLRFRQEIAPIGEMSR